MLLYIAVSRSPRFTAGRTRACLFRGMQTSLQQFGSIQKRGSAYERRIGSVPLSQAGLFPGRR
jgi:hypothetical protein